MQEYENERQITICSTQLYSPFNLFIFDMRSVLALSLVFEFISISCRHNT